MVILILLCLFHRAVGFFAVPIVHLTTARVDPIFTPGDTFYHVHHVYGGNGFGLAETYADARASTCNTSPFLEDKSNYWTNALYRSNTDGTFTLVPSRTMQVYYKFPNNAKELGVEAFPENFRMVAGGPGREDEYAEPMEFKCIGSGYNWGVSTLDELVAETSGGRACEVLQVRMGMPQCYDGRTDSENHRDHTAVLGSDGKCPDTHPRRLVQLFFEFEYHDFEKMNNEMPGAGFIFADSSKIVHADFLNGWDVAKLQEVVNECNDGADGGTQCAKDKLSANPDSNACTIDGKTLVNEEVVNVKTLPGQSNLRGR